jgi:hypothetical protein
LNDEFFRKGTIVTLAKDDGTDMKSWTDGRDIYFMKDWNFCYTDQVELEPYTEETKEPNVMIKEPNSYSFGVSACPAGGNVLETDGKMTYASSNVSDVVAKIGEKLGVSSQPHPASKDHDEVARVLKELCTSVQVQAPSRSGLPKINMIKAHRALTGSDLKEAKDAIERYL